MNHTDTHGREMDTCIEHCTDCHGICLATVEYCLHKGGNCAEPGRIALLLDCADICRTAGDFMIRGSRRHEHVCAVCAEVCEECAAECERMPVSAQARECGRMCRRCAETCREMAAHPAGG